MTEFLLGPLHIQDNGDGVFHAAPPPRGVRLGAGVERRADQITDEQGQPLALDSAQVRQTLNSLGISNFEGLRLTPVSQYFNALTQARTLAEQGQSLDLRTLLDQVRGFATQARLPFSESVAEQLVMRASMQELNVLESQARTSAGQGNVVAVDDAAIAAQDVYRRLGIPVEHWEDSALPFRPTVGQELLRSACRQAIPRLLEQIPALVHEGQVSRLQETVIRLREYHRRGEMTVSADLELRLQSWEGEVHAARSTQALAEATASAARGAVEETRRLLQEARDSARLSGHPFTSEQEGNAAAIERQALLQSINPLLDALEARIQRADTEHREMSLLEVRSRQQQVRDNAGLSGIPLTAAQEERMRQLVLRAYHIDIEWRFRQAADGARQGKVDDTIVPLRAARELALHAGLPFDQRRAEDLMHQSLVEGVELSFRNAQCFALLRDEANVRHHLEIARDYSARLGQAYPEARAQEVLAMLRIPRARQRRQYEQLSCSSLMHSAMPDEAAETQE